MKLEFSDILQKHKNSPAIVVAHGPSLNSYKNQLKTFKDKGHILIGCNEWFAFYPDCPPHYWVLANNVITMRNLQNRINSYDGTVCYADSVDLTDREWIKNNISAKYLPYDQRHTEGRKCGCGDCCNHIIPNRLTIQEQFIKLTNSPTYGSGDTVAVHSLAFAVLFGCNPIYFIGIEIDYRLGYAENSQNLQASISNHSEFDTYKERIIYSLKTITEAAKKIGIKIINANKNSSFKEIEIGDIK